MTHSFDTALARHAAGGGIGLVAEDRPGHQAVRTWPEIDRVTAELVERLHRFDAGPVVVAVDVDNTLGAALALIAVLRTGFPVWPRASKQVTTGHREELLARLTEAGNTVLCAGVDEHGAPHVQLESAGTRRDRAISLPEHSVVLQTGGSTGPPKLLVDTAIRRRPLHPGPARLVSRLNWEPGQRQLVAGPLDHAAPLTFFVEGLFDGNLIVLQRRFEPHAALDITEQWRVRWAQLTPFQLDRLGMTVPGRPEALAGLRALVHTAAPCPERVKRFWIDQIGPGRVFEMYGASEGIGVTIASGAEWLRHPGTVGKGFWTQIRILDDAGRPLPAGEIGKVYLRSGTTARNNRLPRELRTALERTPDGFAGVGDYGHLDEEGYLFLRPRQVDLINVGGEKVYPAEVEKVLLEHAEVLDAVVLGRPDARFGARPHAVVVPRAGAELTEREIKKHCRTVLPNVKVPATVRFVADLPRTPAGKLRRATLDGLLADDHEAGR
jgi:bile acid-coenzyme A ligase